MSRKAQGVNFNGRRIRRVYSGREGCACGCRGNYSENPSAIARTLTAMRRYPMALPTVDPRTGRVVEGPVLFDGRGDDDRLGVVQDLGFCYTVSYETPAGARRVMTAYYDEG